VLADVDARVAERERRRLGFGGRRGAGLDVGRNPRRRADAQGAELRALDASMVSVADPEVRREALALLADWRALLQSNVQSRGSYSGSCSAARGLRSTPSKYRACAGMSWGLSRTLRSSWPPFLRLEKRGYRYTVMRKGATQKTLEFFGTTA